MLLKKVFQTFVEQRPVCVMARGVLERLLDPQRIDALFERTAQQQYTQELLFSQLVELMSEVVLSLQPSVYAGYRAKKKEIGVSSTALYNKLDRVETGVSAELVRDSFRQAAPAVEALGRQAPWLPGYRVKILDGNHLSATEHRIAELRTTWAAPLPGKVLAVLDQERMLVCDAFLTEDGHAQERRLLEEVLTTVQPDDLWIADRNFCTAGMLTRLARCGAFFLIRQHGSLPGRAVGKRKYQGKTATGKVYQQTYLVPDPETGEELAVRRITVELNEKTRDGDTAIHVLSNVPEEDAPACRLADLYGRRWTIETAFFEITTTLTCEVNALGYPKAALFAFCLALVAYNAVSVIKAALRSEYGQETVDEEISAYYLALEIEQAYDGMMVAIPAKHWRVFSTMSVEEFAAVLGDVAQHLDLSKYQKHRRGPKKKQPERTAYQNGSHVSTAKVLAQRKKRC